MSEYNLVQNLNSLKLLPSTWQVIDFNDLVSDNSGGNKKLAKSELLEIGEIAVVDQGKKLVAGYFDDPSIAVRTLPPYVIFGDHTRGFKYIDFPFVMGADGTKVLQPKNEYCNTKYLYYFFLTTNIPNTGYNRHFKYLKALQIPLPPLDQQKKIAAILDAADAYRQKTKALIEKYDELTQSLFLDMFGDPVTNPKGWENKTIESITIMEKGSIKRGPFGGALKKEIFVEEGYLVYEQYHALNNDFTFGRYFIDEAKFQELKGFEVKAGDIIISCSGVYLGKLAVVPQGAKPGIINQALLKVTLDQSIMTNHFFTFHFRQKNFRETFFDANRGAGIPNFPPMSSFKKFPFVVPPINLQKQFTKRVKAIEAQKAQAEASLAQAENLFNSLLQRAFKGELTS